MNIKSVLIPIIGFSIVGLSTYKLTNDVPQTVTLKVAEVEKITSNPVIKQSDSINSDGHWNLSVESPAEIQRLPAEVVVEHIQIQPNAFDHLENGEKLTIHIPQEQHEYIGTVDKSHEQFGGQVKVSSGALDNGLQFSSFTVTKGPELTLVMVSTGERVYQIEINNKTGAGTVIDDQALDVFRKLDDGFMTPPEGIS